MARQKQDDQLEHASSSYVIIWDVALKTCQRRWTIGRSSERGSGISVPVARHDDDCRKPCTIRDLCGAIKKCTILLVFPIMWSLKYQLINSPSSRYCQGGRPPETKNAQYYPLKLNQYEGISSLFECVYAHVHSLLLHERIPSQNESGRWIKFSMVK